MSIFMPMQNKLVFLSWYKENTLTYFVTPVSDKREKFQNIFTSSNSGSSCSQCNKTFLFAPKFALKSWYLNEAKSFSL
jgi:hypothetical protein